MMADERRELRHFLGALTSDQWHQESLCGGWSVRDVVAHLLGWDDLLLYRTRRERLQALLRFSGLYAGSLASMTRLNRRLEARTKDLFPDDLLQRFGADDSPELKWLFDGTNPGAHLAEYVIHHQDIRRPLELPRQIPPERLVAALDGITQLPGVRRSAWWRMRRRRWQATDVSWSRGRGAVVGRPGETILMALVGRSVPDGVPLI
jgi:uncharacterized protein (TIGR03083 family)